MYSQVTVNFSVSILFDILTCIFQDFKRSTTKFTWNFDDLDVAGLFTVYNSAHKSESFVVLDTNNETVMTCKVMLFLKGRKGLENSVSLDLFMFVPPDSKTISCQISSSYKNSEKIYIPVGNHRTFNIDPENSGRHQLGTTPNISSWAVVNSVEFLIQVNFLILETKNAIFILKINLF